MTFAWSAAKNALLKQERGISFERVVVAIDSGDTLAVLEHPNPERNPGQRVYVVEIDGYTWAVPYRDEGDNRVLITAYPSRRLTREYLGGNSVKENNRDDERELIRSIEDGEWREVDDLASVIAEARQIAAATLAKSERMNIRISSVDLKALKAKAAEEGLPYQTLVTSVLHKYVTGQLQEGK